MIRIAALALLLAACTSAPNPQSTEDAYLACLARARSNDLDTRSGGPQSLQRGFPSDRRRDDADLPALRASQTPADRCNDLKQRGRL